MDNPAHIMKNSDKAMLGYDGVSDFMVTLFGWHFNLVNAVIGFMAALTTFITSYIWDSSSAVFTLLSLMLFDWASGTFLAIRAYFLLKSKMPMTDIEMYKYEKRKFSSKRAPRIFVAIPIAFWILSVSWNLSKANPLFYPLPGIVYGGFAGTYLMSLWENLTEMGFFSTELMDLIKEKTNVVKYFKK